MSTLLAGNLLSKPPHPSLVILGASIKFEIAIGLNGWCWVNSSNPASTILVVNTIKGCEGLSQGQAEAFVKRVVSKLWDSNE